METNWRSLGIHFFVAHLPGILPVISHLHSKSPTLVDEYDYPYPIPSSSRLRTLFTYALEEQLNDVCTRGSHGPGVLPHIGSHSNNWPLHVFMPW